LGKSEALGQALADAWRQRVDEAKIPVSLTLSPIFQGAKPTPRCREEAA
jgi:hypothetical protein